MKKYFSRLAAFFVTAYANRLFKQAIKFAEQRHNVEGSTMYVITDPRDPKKLVVIDIHQFLELRHRFEISSKDMPISELRGHCWYRTGKTVHHSKKKSIDKDRLSAKEIDVRRLAFVRELLTRAGLA